MESRSGKRTASGSHGTDAQGTDASIMQMGALMKEGEVLGSTSGRLDEFITIGRTALNELHEQRGMLKVRKGINWTVFKDTIAKRREFSWFKCDCH
jgi:hypothetical protein